MTKNIIIPKQKKILYEKSENLVNQNKIFDSLEQYAEKQNITVHRFENYPSIWLRDFMPIGSNIFHPAFTYMNRNEKILTEESVRCFYKFQEKVTFMNSLLKEKGYFKRIDLYLDGGSCVFKNNLMFISTKIFSDNKKLEKTKIREILFTAFPKISTLVFVEPDLLDKTGHLDSMLRITNSGVILLNDYSKQDPDKHQYLISLMKQYKLDYDLVPVFLSDVPKKFGWYPLDGHYLNYVELNDLCVNNSYKNLEEEKQVELVLRKHFSDIQWVDIYPFSKYGGGIHCLTYQY
jgi:agmatine/peptidylarginine deiminase